MNKKLLVVGGVVFISLGLLFPVFYYAINASKTGTVFGTPSKITHFELKYDPFVYPESYESSPGVYTPSYTVYFLHWFGMPEYPGLSPVLGFTFVFQGDDKFVVQYNSDRPNSWLELNMTYSGLLTTNDTIWYNMVGEGYNKLYAPVIGVTIYKITGWAYNSFGNGENTTMTASFSYDGTFKIVSII